MREVPGSIPGQAHYFFVKKKITQQEEEYIYSIQCIGNWRDTFEFALKEIIRFACVFKIEEIEENVREVQIFYNDTKWLEIFENIYTNDAFE